VRRGLAVVAVAGGALSLVGAAAPGADVAGALGDIGAVEPAEAAGLLRVGTAGSAAAPEPGEVVPVTPGLVPVAAEPAVLDAAALVKAVGLAEQEAVRLADERRDAERRAEEERRAAEDRARSRDAPATSQPSPPDPSPPGPADCGLDTSGLGAVKAWVREAAVFLGCRFGEPAMIGVASRGTASDHPDGKALDLMARGATGDAIAACALQNKAALGITYVIWNQRINHGNGWEPMEDRGSDTANHIDHVHISFASSAGTGATRQC
jgi:hypothetical protein